MPNWKLAPSAMLFIACTIGQADAQSMPKVPGASSLLKGGLPNVSSIGAGNAAGLLGYCVKHKYLSGTSATSVVSGLMKKPGISSSPDYAAGQAGEVLNEGGSPMSLNQVPKELKSRACDLVLKKGATLL